MPSLHEQMVTKAEQRYELLNKAEAIQTGAVNEKGEPRALTGDERGQIESCLSQAEAMARDIEGMKKDLGFGDTIKNLKAQAMNSACISQSARPRSVTGSRRLAQKKTGMAIKRPAMVPRFRPSTRRRPTRPETGAVIWV